MIKCVACGHVHHHLERIEKSGVSYTMCPKCGCGGFTKVKGE